ncbi:MAG TPA: VWA domain-containing protein [Magnetospirillaceae bacterium]|nr:VWA domain-containing protein [Magnetospirillaceae bacterium]
MSIMWLWLLLGLLIPVFAVAMWRLRRPIKRHAHFVGDTPSIANLPSFVREKRRARWLHIANIVVISLLIIVMAIIAARPQQQIRKIEYQNSRDIVLCMDISGSMETYVEPAMQTLLKIVAANPTDRYSLVLFGNVPYVALPLTSDTTAIESTVKDLSAQFTNEKLDAADLVGFDPNIKGGTDIGTGLASCFRRFDNIDQQRSRHIILVSDMEHNGTNDPSAIATLLPKYGIKLYILTPEFNLPDVQENPVTAITGARVESLKFDGSNAEATISAIYNSILTARKTDTYVLVDVPYPFWAAALVLTAAWAILMALRWRRK